VNVHDLGTAFVKALAARDWDTLAEVLDPAVELRAVTPGRVWTAADACAAVAEVFAVWFPGDEVTEAVESLAVGDVLGRARVDYTLRVRNAKGNRYLVEQRAYLDAASDGDRLQRIELICAGFRRLPR
jgi:hypothetical protein